MAKPIPPKPGRPVRGSKSGRPIMAALDLLGRRWALRILWELRQGPHRFRQIQVASAASPSVLNNRLQELRQVGIVELDKAVGYRLTPLGIELLACLAPLNAWSEQWAGLMASPSDKSRRRF